MQAFTYTVIIPAFNAEHTIARAVQSCLNQTISPASIIIIDDASQDDTLKVLNSMNDPRLKVLHLPINSGVSTARNVGWNAADTDYVAFLDSDDEWHPRKFECLLPYLQQHPDTIFCHDFQYVNYKIQPLIISEDVALKSISYWRFLLNNPIVTCSLVVPRNVEVRYDESMRYCEDHDLLLRIAIQHVIKYLPLPLAIVHRQLNAKGGLSGDRWKMRQGELKLYTKVAQHHVFGFLLVPLLWVFSLIKHVKKKIISI